MRKIIHLDMDCFYAAVEMRERPELRGQPIAVGGGSRRGVVTTCNYEARKFGVRSAMPGFMARQLCPHIVFLPVRFDLYRAASHTIRAIFHEYTDLVEPLSLDEAYLDVTNTGRYAWDIAREIRARILQQTGLTSSAGIAPNKMLAKIASDWRKPNGQFAVLPHQVQEFMAALPVRKIWGVGPKSAERLASRGINTCADLQKMTLAEMVLQHGKWGEELYHLCRGEDTRQVHSHRVRKSLSNENTFMDNLISLEQCQAEIEKLAEEMLEELRVKAGDRKIRNAFVTVKFSDFTRTTRQCVCTTPTAETYRELLAEAYSRKPLPVRLLGTGVQFTDEEEDAVPGQERQAELFAE
ncbi:MAG: DNA polymerase IV [Candidatus Methylacidiphilales bacterium]|nr:DNA polymerase IV [Candidatus Methylacidiphilales bacterium]